MFRLIRSHYGFQQTQIPTLYRATVHKGRAGTRNMHVINIFGIQMSVREPGLTDYRVRQLGRVRQYVH